MPTIRISKHQWRPSCCLCWIVLLAIAQGKMREQAACRKVVYLVVLDQVVGTIVEGMKRQLMERIVGNDSQVARRRRQQRGDRSDQEIIELVQQAGDCFL